MAQDELQTAEHPILGSIVETGEHFTTRAPDGSPTPILITGIQRRVKINLDRNAAEGRPCGLYGNYFMGADEDVVRRATVRVDPPTITNIIAMVAPDGGYGNYDLETIRDVLDTAYTSFRAAVMETPARMMATIHTGNWGTGAFGGNKVLMAALQLIAARMAGVPRLVFHTLETGPFEAALRLVADVAPAGTPIPLVLRSLVERNFVWGVSDGN